jgi:CheY-like chemotaxis protein
MKTLQVLDGLRVLLVDDDADSLELVRFILEQYHAQVSSTPSTYEALQVIRLWKPDILISDIAMPEAGSSCCCFRGGVLYLYSKTI